MANQPRSKGRRGANPGAGRPKPRRVEHVALSAEAHCGPRRRRRSFWRVLILVALLGAGGLQVWPVEAATVDPAPGSTYWAQNAPTVHADPQRTGYTDVALRAADADVRWDWHGQAPILSGAVVDKDQVYVVDRDGRVTALDLKSGHEVWNVTLSATVRTTPTLAYGWLYVPTEKNTLVALSSTDGTKLAEAKLAGAGRAPPLVAEGRVFQGTDAGVLQVLDATTLDEVWRFDTATTGYDANRTTATLDADLRKPIRAAPAVSDGRVFVAAWNGRVYSLSTTGNTYGHPDAWHWTFNAGDIVQAAPAVDKARATVYVATADGVVHSLWSSSGTLRWSRDLDHAVVAGVALGTDMLIAGTADGRMHRIEPQYGREVWTRDEPGGLLGGLALTKDTIVGVAANGTVAFVDPATGDTWTREVPLPSTNASANETAANNTTTTPAVWSLPGAIHAPPAVTRAGVFVTGQGGAVWRIGPAPDLVSDLRVASVQRPSLPAPNATGTLVVTLSNAGPDPARDAQLTVRVDAEVVHTEPVPLLAVGASTTHNITLGPYAVGDHVLTVAVAPKAGRDPTSDDATTTLGLSVADPAAAAAPDPAFPTGEDGEVDWDAFYGKDEAPEAEARSPWVLFAAIPVGLGFLAVGVLLARWRRGDIALPLLGRRGGAPTPADG